MKHIFIVSAGLSSLLLLLILVNVTSPLKVGPFGVLAFFILLYFAIVCFSYIALLSARKMISGLVSGYRKARIIEISRLKIYYYASVLSLAPVIMVGMVSMGGIGVLEVGLIFVFEVIAIFYIHKRF